MSFFYQLIEAFYHFQYFFFIFHIFLLVCVSEFKRKKVYVCVSVRHYVQFRIQFNVGRVINVTDI